MMVHTPHMFLALISGSIFTLIMFSIFYQESYFPQQSSDKRITKEFPGNTRNYSTNKVSILRGVLPDLIPSSNKRPRPLTVPVTSKKGECVPFFEDLRIKAVLQDDCDQPYVTMNPTGRQGNKMSQYASLYLLRHFYGVRVSIQKSMKDFLSLIMKNIDLPVEDTMCFNKTTKNISYRVLYMKLYKAAFQAKTNATDNNLIVKSLLNASYHVRNYPQIRHVMLAHRDLVRSFFTFRDEVVKQAIDNINKALKPFNGTYQDRNFPVVTVHVRRTDYARHLKNLYNMTVVDELYFTRAFEFYKTRLRRPVFLVLSDDPEWCRKKLQAKDVVVAASASPPVDMAVMSLGDHHVISYGTFSFNGALLGRGHITHPIGHKLNYDHNDCVHSPFFHYISRDLTYEVDNSHVVFL